MATLCKMTAEHEEKMSIYDGPSGSFRGVTSDKWETCRERFHYYYRLNAGFYYHLQNNQTPKMVCNYLTKVEDILKLPESDRITIYHNTSSVILVQIPEWWYDAVRVNLLTILLREANNHDPKKHINSPMLTETIEAFHHFLTGNTFYNDDTFFGWVTTFKGKENSAIRTLLKNKPTARKYINVVHHNSWLPVVMPLAQ